MRRGKVKLHATRRFHLRVAMELRPVVGRDRLAASGVSPQELEGGPVRFLRCPLSQLADEDVTGLAFHYRQDAVTALPGALPHHRVDLPVPDSPALLDRGWALSDHPLARQSPPAVIASIPLSARFARTSQVSVQRSAFFPIRPDMTVNRFVADRQLASAFQMPRDLLRAPLFPQQFLHSSPVLPLKLAVAPGVSPSRLRSFLRLIRSIPAIVPRPIAPQLPPHCAPVSSQFPRDLRLVQPQVAQRRQHAPFFSLELVVIHLHSLLRVPALRDLLSFTTLLFDVLHLLCEFAGSNQSVELTATRCTPTLFVIKTPSLRAPLALGGGSSLLFR
jgi:hypothetical protein